jgi:tripartite-type tricarboxylate transporter receptor subunit TctC
MASKLTLTASLAASSLALAAFHAAAATSSYPDRPIRMIVPYAPGGNIDTTARAIAPSLTEALGQQIIIDNRGGAAGVLGMRIAAKAAPDGYTITMSHTGTTSINPSLYASPGYDPRRDFSPIGLISSTPIVLMTHPSFPAKSLAELIALAKNEPGKLNLGTPPPGTGGYLAAELFKSVASVDVTIVPFKGTAQLTNDLVGNHVSIGFNVLAPAMGNLQSGTLRAMAVLGPTRSSLFPDVPTASESGLPGYEAMLHYGLLAPANTPKEIVARLNQELKSLINSSAVRERIAADGGDPLPSSAEEYAADIDREEAKWSVLIKKLNLKKVE